MDGASATTSDRKRWLVLAAASIAVAAVGTVGAGTAWDDWALLLGAVLGRCATAGMIAAIASVPFSEDPDAAPHLFGAAAGFVARTVIRFRSWPT